MSRFVVCWPVTWFFRSIGLSVGTPDHERVATRRYRIERKPPLLVGHGKIRLIEDGESWRGTMYAACRHLDEANAFRQSLARDDLPCVEEGHLTALSTGFP